MAIAIKCNISKLPKPPYKPAKKYPRTKPDIPFEESLSKYSIKGSSRNKFYTPEIDADIVRMHKSGKSWMSIAEKYGRKPTAVEARYRKLCAGRFGEKYRWTPEQDEVVRQMRAQGKPYSEIADQIGKSKEAIRKRAKIIL